jgi:hypothetical protein
LTGLYQAPDHAGVVSFPDACNFPDEARQKARDNKPGWDVFDEFDKWHFLNLPRTAHLVNAGHCRGNCVVTGIAHHGEQLAQGPGNHERAEALFFLSHWMGDVHQPLHVSFENDRGGNEIKPIAGGFYASGHLHAVWDSGILTKAIGTLGWRAYADQLASAITPAEKAAWSGGEPISWAQESYSLTTKPKVQYCKWHTVNGTSSCDPIANGRTLAQPYQTAFEDDVELRLQQAGVRLADLLRRQMVIPSS